MSVAGATSTEKRHRRTDTTAHGDATARPLDRSAPRLYVRGLFLGYKRSKANQHVNTALLKLDHVECTEDARWYLGKRAAYIYKAKTEKKGSKFRCIWGKVRVCVYVRLRLWT